MNIFFSYCHNFSQFRVKIRSLKKKIPRPVYALSVCFVTAVILTFDKQVDSQCLRLVNCQLSRSASLRHCSSLHFLTS